MKFLPLFRGLSKSSRCILAAPMAALVLLGASLTLWSQSSARTAVAPVGGKSLRYCNPLPLVTSSSDGAAQGGNLGDGTVVRDGPYMTSV